MQMRQELEAILYNRNEAPIIYPHGDAAPFEPVKYPETPKPVDVKAEIPVREMTVSLFGQTTTPDATESIFYGHAAAESRGNNAQNDSRSTVGIAKRNNETSTEPQIVDKSIIPNTDANKAKYTQQDKSSNRSPTVSVAVILSFLLIVLIIGIVIIVKNYSGIRHIPVSGAMSEGEGSTSVTSYDGYGNDSTNLDSNNQGFADSSDSSSIPDERDYIPETPENGVYNYTFLMDTQIVPYQYDDHAGTSDWLRRLTNERLLEIDQYNNVVFVLAQNYTIYDELTIEFGLREGVYFHNGNRLTAQDVVWTYMTVKQYVLNGMIENIVAVDDYTVRLELSESFVYHEIFPSSDNSMWNAFLDEITHPFILNRMAMEEDRFIGALVGTGAFAFTDYIPNYLISLQPYDNYWEYLDISGPMQFVISTDLSIDQRMTMLQSGEADIIFMLNENDLASYENHSSVSNGFSVYTVVLRNPEYHGYPMGSLVYGIIGPNSFGGMMQNQPDEFVINEMRFRVLG